MTITGIQFYKTQLIQRNRKTNEFHFNEKLNSCSREKKYKDSAKLLFGQVALEAHERNGDNCLGLPAFQPNSEQRGDDDGDVGITVRLMSS